jgi:hypothetical protein
MRPSKIEGSPLEILSSQVLKFEGKARANPIGGLSDASLLGKLLVLPANVRLDWKVIARYKHFSLFGLFVSNEEKSFYNIDTCGLYYKTITIVIRRLSQLTPVP